MAHLHFSVLDAAAQRPLTDAAEPFPEAELRTAAAEFFRTVRALLGLKEEDEPSAAPTGDGQASSSGTSTDCT
jgi:hypothetical protein